MVAMVALVTRVAGIAGVRQASRTDSNGTNTSAPKKHRKGHVSSAENLRSALGRIITHYQGDKAEEWRPEYLRRRRGTRGHGDRMRCHDGFKCRQYLHGPLNSFHQVRSITYLVVQAFFLYAFEKTQPWKKLKKFGPRKKLSQILPQNSS